MFQALLSERVINSLFITISVFVTIVVTNVLQQVLLKKRNEPPVILHLLPVIGSTVSYGIDPFKFFSRCQAQVRESSIAPLWLCIAC